MRGRFRAANENLRASALRAIFFSSITNPATRFVNSVVYALVAVIGSLFAIARPLVMSVGDLTCFLSYASQYTKPELPQMNVGDTVRVHVKIKEGSRERIQVFEGIIIARKHGGIEESITVRRISYNVGCEKVFPVHSPNIVNIETVRRGKVRRAKLYYLRQRAGKAAKVKEKL